MYGQASACTFQRAIASGANSSAPKMMTIVVVAVRSRAWTTIRFQNAWMNAAARTIARVWRANCGSVGRQLKVGALGRSARGRLRDNLLDPLERQLQVVLRVRVADADVVLADLSEGRARERANAAVVEQRVGHLRPVHARARDVREDVESAVWHAATNARNVVQPVDDELAPRAELLDHGLDGVLRPVERLDGGHLLEAARAAHAVDDQLAERIDERLR